MIAIFDIDSLVYEACYGAEELEEAIDRFFNRYNNVIYEVSNRFDIKGVIPVGFCKANRTSEKPKFFNELIDHIQENINVQNRRGIETDDLVVKYHEYYGKDGSIIISIDKDYNQCEGLIWSYKKGELIVVNKAASLFNFYSQMVIGDTADNVNYIKGVGKAWCDKNLIDKNEYSMRRAVYTLFKQRYRSKAKEMYIRCYLLLKLNVF